MRTGIKDQRNTTRHAAKFNAFLLSPNTIVINATNNN
jgi:hypothetical protein